MPTQDPTKKTKKAAAKKAGPTPRRPRSTRTDPTQAPSPDGPPQLTVVPGGQEDKYAPSAWGSGPEVSGPQDLDLPSGQLVLARKPGIQQLMVEGVLHKMDNLTALVDAKHIRKGKGGKPDDVDVKSLIGDTKSLTNILHTVDRVVCAVVLRPKVEMAPNDITRRQNGHIYADTVAIEDKMFIFNWALGGSKDIERFRSESAAVVGSLEPGEPVADQAE